jgi:hypothetical protein
VKPDHALGIVAPASGGGMGLIEADDGLAQQAISAVPDQERSSSPACVIGATVYEALKSQV